jgi:HEAT repeat protein
MRVGPAEQKAAAAVLLELLRDSHPEIRSQAANTAGLADVDPHAAAHALVALLKDPEPSIRAQAIFNLRKINPATKKAFIPELTALLQDKDGNIRLDALQALRELPALDPKTAGAVLAETTHDAKPQIRTRVATLVGTVGEQAKDGGCRDPGFGRNVAGQRTLLPPSGCQNAQANALCRG